MKREFKQNVYDPSTGKLVYTAGQAHAFAKLKEFYAEYFGQPTSQQRRETSGDYRCGGNPPTDFVFFLGVVGGGRGSSRERIIPTPTIGRPNRWPETTSRPKRSSGACSA